MELLRIEIKKLIKYRFLWLMLFCFLITDGYKIQQMHKNENHEIEGYEVIYEQIKGELTSEKINFVMENYQKALDVVETGVYDSDQKQDGTYSGTIYGDMVLFEEFYQQLKELYFYHEEMSEIVNRAKENSSFFQEEKNFYQWKKNEMIQENYGARAITHYYQTENMAKFLTYDFSKGLVLLLLLLAVPYILLNERQTGMVVLLESSYQGLRKAVIAKLLAAGLLVCFLTVSFHAADLIFFQVFYGLEAFFQPLYSVAGYSHTFLNLSIIEYILFELVLNFSGYLLIAVFLFGSSMLLRDSIKIAVSGLIMIGGFILICLHTNFYFNPILLLVTKDLVKEFSTVSLFSQPVFLYQAVLTSTLIIGLFLAVLIILLTGNKNHRRRPYELDKTRNA